MTIYLRYIYLIGLAYILAIQPAVAQKRKAKPVKTTAPDSVTLARQADAIASAINTYQFTEAERLLQAGLTQAQRHKLPTTHLETQLGIVRRGQTMLQATAQVLVIDSFVVDRQATLQAIKLSQHSGRILTIEQLQSIVPTQVGPSTAIERGGYSNEFGDRLIFPKLNPSSGTLQLAQSDFVGGQWQEAHFLQGLPHDGYQHNYPFLMADGITIYYSAQGDESLGGYDIFVSRYNRESKQFLLPENIGMPFNSPANDYLYAIDEVNNLGWFVSDRYQPIDKVCVYVFAPITQRALIADAMTDADSLRIYASLQSIAYTQSDMNAVLQGKQRLATLQHSTQHSATNSRSSFTFIINDTQTYTSLSQFRSPQARQQVQVWLRNAEELKSLHKQLEVLYKSPGNSRERILQTEAKVLELSRQQHQLSQSIRALELAS